MKTNQNETKLVVITRSDITPGYQAVQSTHSVADFAAEYPENFKKWKSETNSIICLGVLNETELLKLYNKFKDKTQSVIFFEPDVNEYTSLCIYGTPEIRKKLNNLPLLLKDKKNQTENEHI